MKVAAARATDAEVLSRIREGKLVETVEQMSPAYLEGMIRILTVSADTELISAPAYFNAAKTCSHAQCIRIRNGDHSRRTGPCSHRLPTDARSGGGHRVSDLRS